MALTTPDTVPEPMSILCGPPVPDNPFLRFSTVCRRAHKRYGKRSSLVEFVRSKRFSSCYANKALANFDVIVRWNHRNLKVTVDPQDPQWFMRMRDAFARLISIGTAQPIDARRVRLEIAHNKLGASSISDSQTGLDQTYLYSVLGLRLVVLAVPEGRLMPLGEPPVYVYPELPICIPGTIQTEVDRNNAIGDAQRVAGELKQVLNEVMVPIATRLVKMREKAPDGLHDTELKIQEAMYTAAPMTEQHSMSTGGNGRLRSSLEAAWCPDVTQTATDIAYEYARRVCKLRPTASALSDAQLETDMFRSCQQVANEFAQRAMDWRTRTTPRQECPSPIVSANAIPVDLHIVGAPIGAKTYEAIDQHVIAASYEDPYRTGVSFGATADEALAGHGIQHIFSPEIQDRISEAARSSAKGRAHFICQAIARKYRSQGHMHVRNCGSEHAQVPSKEFVAVRTHLLSGRPELDVIRVSPIQNLIAPTKPIEHKNKPTKYKKRHKHRYHDNCSRQLEALGLMEINCVHCKSQVKLLGVSEEVVAKVAPTQCDVCGGNKTKNKKKNDNKESVPHIHPAENETPQSEEEISEEEESSEGEEEESGNQKEGDGAATGGAPAVDPVPAKADAEPTPNVPVAAVQVTEKTLTDPLAATGSAGPSAESTGTRLPVNSAPSTEPKVTDLSWVLQAPPAPPLPRAAPSPATYPDVSRREPMTRVLADQANQAPTGSAPVVAIKEAADSGTPANVSLPAEQVHAHPIPTVGPGKPIERVAVEVPLPPLPPTGMTRLRVVNSSLRDITVKLSRPRDNSIVAVIRAPASRTVDSDVFPYGKYQVDVTDSKTGERLSISGNYAFIAGFLHALDFAGTGTIKMRILHGYFAERIAPINWFWKQYFGVKDQPFRGSADTGIYILPSSANIANVGTHHIFVKASAEAVKTHMRSTFEDDGLFTDGKKTTYSSFSVPANTNNVGVPLTITRDELNGKMAVKRADGSIDWAPILNVLPVSRSVANSGHGSVVFVVDATLDEILGAAKN